MTYRIGSDAKDTIEELYNSFAGLRKEDQFNTAVLYGRHASYLAKDLEAAGFKTIVPVASSAIDHHARDAEAELLEDARRFYIQDRTGRRKARTELLEIAAAWNWNQLDVGGRLSQAVLRAMVVRPAADVWLCWRPFSVKGKDDDEAETYRSTYYPFYAEVGNGRSSAWLEDNGLVTLAVRKVVKPAMRVFRDFDKRPDKDRTPAQIFAEDYPNLRVGFGVAEDDERFFTSELTLWELDDGSHRCTYVEMPHADPGDRYQSISETEGNEPLPNPFGRPSMLYACGFWNPDADKIEDRYQGFIRPLTLQRYKMDQIESFWESLYATLPQNVLQAPVEVLQTLAGMSSNKEREEFLNNVMAREHAGILQVIGEFKQAETPVPALLDKHYAEAKEEYIRLLPQPSPAEQTIKDAAVSNLVMWTQGRKRRYASPNRGFNSLMHDLTSMCFDYWRVQDDSPVYNTKGVETYESQHFMTNGNEGVRGKQIKNGMKGSVGPEELGDDDSWYDLFVVNVDLSPSAKAAKRQEAVERKASGSITHEDYFELLDVVNIPDYMKKLDVQELMATWKSPKAAIEFARAVRYQALLTGMNEEQYLATIQGGPVMSEQGQALTPSGPMRVGAPQMDTVGQTVSS